MFVIAGCAIQTPGAALQIGMTPAEAVSAMGEPDLKGRAPDPSHGGASFLRYTWLSAGKSATFGADGRLVSVEDVGPAPGKTATVQPEETKPMRFDLINTPFDYLFYPVRVLLIYLGAAVNCAGGGECRRPQLPSPSPD